MARSTIETILVRSSLIAEVEYAADASLYVKFTQGEVYRYFAVPRCVLDAFVAAESKGAYFNHRIRARFPYTRIRS